MYEGGARHRALQQLRSIIDTLAYPDFLPKCLHVQTNVAARPTHLPSTTRAPFHSKGRHKKDLHSQARTDSWTGGLVDSASPTLKTSYPPTPHVEPHLAPLSPRIHDPHLPALLNDVQRRRRRLQHDPLDGAASVFSSVV